MRFGDLKKAEAKEAAVKKRAAINKGYCDSAGVDGCTHQQAHCRGHP